jgi:hypothetical protein
MSRCIRRDIMANRHSHTVFFRNCFKIDLINLSLWINSQGIFVSMYNY